MKSALDAESPRIPGSDSPSYLIAGIPGSMYRRHSCVSDWHHWTSTIVSRIAALQVLAAASIQRTASFLSPKVISIRHILHTVVDIAQTTMSSTS